MDLEAYFDGLTRRDWQETEEGTVRFAMLGLGWWTTDHAMPAVEDSELCETTVVVSGSKGKAERVAAANGVEHALTYEEYGDGAATDAYDAVYICTPNAVHLQHVEAAAEHGKDVLCEKPMEASVERAEAMVEAADAGDVTLMIAYRMQTEPAVRRARELVRDGVIGEPLHVHGHMSQPLLSMIPDPDQWRLNPDLAGPGASVTDLGIYPINTARFVLDDDPASVTSVMASESEGFEDVPDERAGFAVRFEGGAIAACSASQNAYQSGHLKITGSEGEVTIESAFFNRYDRTLSVSRNGNTAETTFPTIDQMEEEFTYFADRLLAGRPVHPDGEHGLVDIRAIEAVYEAAETGERVDL